MSIEKREAILKCPIEIKSFAWFMLGSENETMFHVTLKTSFSLTAG